MEDILKQYNIAVVGATGMVGRKFLQVLEERRLPVAEYYLFASSRSAGQTIRFMDRDYTVLELTETCMQAVSYTHLDVYKRQPCPLICSHRRDMCCRSRDKRQDRIA